MRDLFFISNEISQFTGDGLKLSATQRHIAEFRLLIDSRARVQIEEGTFISEIQVIQGLRQHRAWVIRSGFLGAIGGAVAGLIVGCIIGILPVMVAQSILILFGHDIIVSENTKESHDDQKANT